MLQPSALRLIAALLLSVTAAACGGSEPASPAAATGGAPPAVPVEIVTLDLKPVERIGEFVGTISSLASTTVQPQAEGFLTRILVTSGQRVGPGTPLFQIDSAAQQAGLASLEAQRASRVADTAYAKQQAERMKALLDAGAASRQAYDQAVTQAQTNEALLKAIEDQIRQQQTDLGYFRVTAQTAGVIGDVPVRVGDRVTRATALTTIEDNSRLEAHVSVPVQQAADLRLGLPVRLVDDAGTVLATTRVSFVASSVDDATQTVLVKAPVDAKAGVFRAAQFIRAQVVWNAEPGLTVPLLAAQRINHQYFVFVAESANGGLVARQRPVTLGQVVGDEYIALSGLSRGDRLILAGTQKIGDGMPVQALPAPAAPADANRPAAATGGA